MKKNFLYLIIMLITMGLFCPGCQQKKPLRISRQITVSILPQKYFVQKIGGDTLNINVLIPPGASPATYSPTPSQMVQLSTSSLYFRIGHIGFEQAWASHIEQNNPDLLIVNLSTGFPLIKGKAVHHGDHDHEGGVDPHLWMSVPAARHMAQIIARTFSEQFPNRANAFQENLKKLEEELNTLEDSMNLLLKPIKGKTFIIFHPALGYLARDYNLQQHTLEMEGKIPSPAHLKKIIETAKKENIHTVFIQAEFDQDNASLLAREIKGQVVPINPLAEDWSGEMLRISKILNQSHHE